MIYNKLSASIIVEIYTQIVLITSLLYFCGFLLLNSHISTLYSAAYLKSGLLVLLVTFIYSILYIFSRQRNLRLLTDSNKLSKLFIFLSVPTFCITPFLMKKESVKQTFSHNPQFKNLFLVDIGYKLLSGLLFVFFAYLSVDNVMSFYSESLNPFLHNQTGLYTVLLPMLFFIFFSVAAFIGAIYSLEILRNYKHISIRSVKRLIVFVSLTSVYAIFPIVAGILHVRTYYVKDRSIIERL